MLFSLSTLILFMPASVCLFWLLLDFIVARKTSSYPILQTLSFVLLLFFFADACYCTPGAHPETLIYTHLITIFAGPCVIPLIWLYFAHLKKTERYSKTQFLWIVLPFALLFSGISLTETLGTEQLSRFISDFHSEGNSVLPNYHGMPQMHYYLWTHIVFRISVGIELALASFYLIRFVVREKVSFANLWAFLRKDKPLRVTELQVFTLIVPALFVLTKVLFTKKYLDTHLWVSITQAVLISLGFFLFRLCAWFSETESLNRTRARHIMMDNYNPDSKASTVEMMIDELWNEADKETRNKLEETLLGTAAHVQHKEENPIKELLFNSMDTQAGNNLLIRFQAMMIKEQLYLKPSLSLADVAERLRTNKTYISKIVNKAYNLGFPELMNILRVNYAQKYIKNHPGAKQEEIARVSGFQNASAFNNIFKKITGTTPKVWMLNNHKEDTDEGLV